MIKYHLKRIKQNPIYCLKETHFRSKAVSTKTESEGMEKIFNENRSNKKMGAAILTSDRKDFKPKAMTKDRDIIQQQRDQCKKRILYLLAYMHPVPV